MDWSTAAVTGGAFIVGVATGAVLMRQRYHDLIRAKEQTVLHYADRYDRLRESKIKAEVSSVLDSTVDPRSPAPEASARVYASRAP